LFTSYGLDKNTTYQETARTSEIHSNSYSYSYSTCVNVNGHHWNTRKLVFTRTRTRVPGLVLIPLWSTISNVLLSV